MSNQLYHKDIHLPVHLVNQFLGKSYRLKLSGHAIRSCLNDRYGRITAPRVVDNIRLDEIIEAEVEHGKTVKILVRRKHCERFDMLIALMPFGDGTGLARTMWLNDRTDRHGTLQRHRYVQR